MKVLVTGGAGFIGQSLLTTLEKKNIDFVTIGRTNPRRQAQHITADLLENENFPCLKKLKSTHLIHLAWYTKHQNYWDSPLNLKWAAATYILLEKFFQANGGYALITGTCAEYDWKFGYCTEDVTPIDPKTLYGVTKDYTRRLSESLAEKYEASLGWARIFFPYGANESSKRLIPSLFSAFRGNLPLFGVNKSAYRDLLHVSDTAEALCSCLQNKFVGPVNICSGNPIQLGEIVKLVASICNREPNLIFNSTQEKGGNPGFLVGNNEKLITTGWSQNISLENGLLNYERQSYGST